MSWAAWLESVSVPMAIPVRLGVEHDGDGECVFVELSVRCSRTGEPITVKTRRRVQPMSLLTTEQQHEVVRDLVRTAICHEIDEAITVWGERVFDPHRTPPSPVR